MKKLLISVAIVMVGIFSFANVSQVSANEPEGAGTVVGRKKCSAGFLGFPAWYDGVINSDDCTIKVPDSGDSELLSKFIWRIALNILQIALTAVAYVAAFYIIYGGFKYMTSRGSADGISKGKVAIQNAVIGLIIALSSIGAVNLIISGLKLGSEGSIPDISATEALANVLNLAYFATGVLAIFAIIIASFMYVISRGDAGEIAKAKMAIIYSVAGLVVVSLAFTVTNFIIGRF